MILYGLKNCDMTQKGLKFLQKNNFEYSFHDYKESGIDEKTIRNWLKYLPLKTIFNTRSTTYRGFSDTEKEASADPGKAIDLMVKYNSVIKRPILDLGNNKFLVGFEEGEWRNALPLAPPLKKL
jgi:arsenate reductase